MAAKSTYRIERFTSWDRFREVVSSPEYRSWAFRGQSSADWPLFSSLSRYLLKYQVHPDAWPQQESRILRVFKRKAHLILQHLPDQDDQFEWLALMQHHGAPTRLIDFSWSPFVATFFALENASEAVAIWAVFPPGLNDRPTRTTRASQTTKSNEIGPWINGAYEKHFLPNKRKVAVIGEPHRMNQRLVAQSGTFVIPGLLQRPVDELVPSSSIVKFVLDAKQLRRHAMAELYTMNISNATLFPGLDGLARSLAYELEHHWAFDPLTMKTLPGFAM